MLQDLVALVPEHDAEEVRVHQVAHPAGDLLEDPVQVEAGVEVGRGLGQELELVDDARALTALRRGPGGAAVLFVDRKIHRLDLPMPAACRVRPVRTRVA